MKKCCISKIKAPEIIYTKAYPTVRFDKSRKRAFIINKITPFLGRKGYF